MLVQILNGVSNDTGALLALIVVSIIDEQR